MSGREGRDEISAPTALERACGRLYNYSSEITLVGQLVT